MSVAATISAGRAAAQNWDVAVIGAGPAGSWLAGLVAAAGRRVLLVDRSEFPRPKVCGGCLSARTAEQLDAAGITADLANAGARRVDRLRLVGWGRAVEMPLPAGIAVSRDVLDTLLVRTAIRRGAQFLPGHRVALDAAAGGVRRLRIGPGSEEKIEASIVVDATGLGGSLIGQEMEGRIRTGRRVGCSAVVPRGDGFEPGVVHMAVGTDGYVGVALLEGERLNLAAAFDHGAMRRLGPGETARRILQEAGAGIPDALPQAVWTGTRRLTRRPPTRAGERLFAVGDAAGYVEPFTGEGIGWALRSASLLAPIVVGGVRRWSEELIGAWNAVHERELVRRQQGCRALAWVLRHPPAARCALMALQCRPQLGTPFIRRLHGPELAGVGGSGS